VVVERLPTKTKAQDQEIIDAWIWNGPTPRMSETELSQAMDWVADHFVLIRADDEAPTTPNHPYDVQEAQ
jgi:hypothetical protein